MLFPVKVTVSPMICVQLWPLPETPVPLKLTAFARGDDCAAEIGGGGPVYGHPIGIFRVYWNTRPPRRKSRWSAR